MSHHRISPKAGWANPKQLPKGPTGRPCCRYCSQEVPKGRRTFCSETCVHEWKVRTDPGYVRRKVQERDRGICAQCGLDTDAFIETIYREYRWVERDQVLRARGFNPHGHRWEADHIVPVSEGGGECGLENYRTLCIPCHRAATKQLHQRRSAAKTGQHAQHHQGGQS